MFQSNVQDPFVQSVQMTKIAARIQKPLIISVFIMYVEDALLIVIVLKVLNAAQEDVQNQEQNSITGDVVTFL